MQFASSALHKLILMKSDHSLIQIDPLHGTSMNIDRDGIEVV